MKKKLEYWDIPRSDKRERCAKCLRVFKREERKIKSKEHSGYRFDRVGLCCNVINDELKKETKVSIMLDIYGK